MRRCGAGHDVWVLTGATTAGDRGGARDGRRARAAFRVHRPPAAVPVGQAALRPPRAARLLLPVAGGPRVARAAAPPPEWLRRRAPRHVRQRHAAERPLRPARPVRVGARRWKHPQAAAQDRPRPPALRPPARADPGHAAVPARARRPVRRPDAAAGRPDPRLHAGGARRPVPRRAPPRPRDRAHRDLRGRAAASRRRRLRTRARAACGSSPGVASSTGRATTS